MWTGSRDALWLSQEIFLIKLKDLMKDILYFEDVDLCRKARENGYKVIFEPSVSVIHTARHQSRATSGIITSLINNKTSRYHLSSWIKYILNGTLIL